MPTALHPYRFSGPSASRSSQDISTLPIQDSYLLHNLSAQDLRSRSSSQRTRSPSPINLIVPSDESSHTPESVAILSRPLSEADHSGRLCPRTPEDIGEGRYERQAPISEQPTQYTIDPLTTSPASLELPDGWEPCLHPEGVQYFFLEDFSARTCVPATEGCVKRVFTNSNILKPELHAIITEAMHTIADFIRAENIEMQSVDLVLDASSVEQTMRCKYYFVNHKTRYAFWMDKAESSWFPVTYDLNGITSESRMHIRHELEAQYWLHCHMFPTSLPEELKHEAVHEFRDIVNYSLEDLLMSPTSTVPYKVEQLVHMGHLADGFSSEEYFNILRLSSNDTRKYWHKLHRFDLCVESTNALLRPLLFCAPDSHLVGLNTIYTDGLIRHRNWAEFIVRLCTEWQELTAYATVVLNANVSFLSIQSVDQGGSLS
ncbi:hypothetical protein B0H19DRAFT_1248417 [Mycena capillaripes]|nr:hypothetical protein B0H19DRAFT_1248417 [Mycena capillaripes]